MTTDDSDQLLDAAFIAYEEQRLVDAEALADRVLRLEPDSLLARHLLALTAAQSGKRERAIGLLTSVIDQDPMANEAMSDLCYLLKEESRLDEAIDVLARACRLAPDSAQARNSLGECYLAVGRPEDA